MSKIKSTLSMLLCICIAFLGMSICTKANEAAPYNIAVTAHVSSFSINEAGLASCYSSASVRDGYTIQTTMQLQQKKSMWKNVQSWTNTDTSYVVFDETYQVEKGYDYRLMAVYIAYDSEGNQVEAFYDLSDIISYR